MVWILWLYLINSLFMLIVAVREARRPANALLWLTTGIVLPAIWFGIYMSASYPIRVNRERLTSPSNEGDWLPESFGNSTLAIAHSLRHFTVQGLKTCYVQVLTNGIETYKKLSESIQNAQRTIDITTPYFMTDVDIIMAIKTAVSRGARVRLLVPRKMEPLMGVVAAASRTYYGELLESGVNIYQYNKGILHTKVMILDGEIAEIGAANYDIRSFALDYEVGQVYYSADLARELTEQFQRDLTDSIPLSIEDLVHRPRLQRILDQGARLLSPDLVNKDENYHYDVYTIVVMQIR